MDKEKFFSSLVADIFFVSDVENVNVAEFHENLGFYITWKYSGKTSWRYLDLCDVQEILAAMRTWFSADSPAVLAWEKALDTCIKEYHDENK